MFGLNRWNYQKRLEFSRRFPFLLLQDTTSPWAPFEVILFHFQSATRLFEPFTYTWSFVCRLYLYRLIERSHHLHKAIVHTARARFRRGRLREGGWPPKASGVEGPGWVGRWGLEDDAVVPGSIPGLRHTLASLLLLLQLAPRPAATTEHWLTTPLADIYHIHTRHTCHTRHTRTHIWIAPRAWSCTLR